MGGIKRLRVSLLVLAVILAAGATVYLRIPREPRYQGRSLSQWLESGARQNPYCYSIGVTRNFPGDPSRQAVLEAIQAIGTNAIPFLLRWSYAQDSRPKAAMISWLNSRLVSHFHLWSAREYQSAAYIGFALLEGQAKPAWPVFIQWIADKDPERRRFGLYSLINCQADASTLIPVFRRIFDGNDLELQDQVLGYFPAYCHNQAVIAAIYKHFPKLDPQNHIRTADFNTNQSAAK